MLPIHLESWLPETLRQVAHFGDLLDSWLGLTCRNAIRVSGAVRTATAERRRVVNQRAGSACGRNHSGRPAWFEAGLAAGDRHSYVADTQVGDIEQNQVAADVVAGESVDGA